jgi:hypothetical protein
MKSCQVALCSLSELHKNQDCFSCVTWSGYGERLQCFQFKCSSRCVSSLETTSWTWRQNAVLWRHKESGGIPPRIRDISIGELSCQSQAPPTLPPGEGSPVGGVVGPTVSVDIVCNIEMASVRNRTHSHSLYWHSYVERRAKERSYDENSRHDPLWMDVLCSHLALFMNT